MLQGARKGQHAAHGVGGTWPRYPAMRRALDTTPLRRARAALFWSVKTICSAVFALVLSAALSHRSMLSLGLRLCRLECQHGREVDRPCSLRGRTTRPIGPRRSRRMLSIAAISAGPNSVSQSMRLCGVDALAVVVSVHHDAADLDQALLVIHRALSSRKRRRHLPTVCSCTPISAATALFVRPSAQRRIMRQRSEIERATRRRRACASRYDRSSSLKTSAASGRPIPRAIAMTSVVTPRWPL